MKTKNIKDTQINESLFESTIQNNKNPERVYKPETIAKNRAVDNDVRPLKESYDMAKTDEERNAILGDIAALFNPKQKLAGKNSGGKHGGVVKELAKLSGGYLTLTPHATMDDLISLAFAKYTTSYGNEAEGALVQAFKAWKPKDGNKSFRVILREYIWTAGRSAIWGRAYEGVPLNAYNWLINKRKIINNEDSINGKQRTLTDTVNELRARLQEKPIGNLNPEEITEEVVANFRRGKHNTETDGTTPKEKAAANKVQKEYERSQEKHNEKLQKAVALEKEIEELTRTVERLDERYQFALADMAKDGKDKIKAAQKVQAVRLILEEGYSYRNATKAIGMPAKTGSWSRDALRHFAKTLNNLGIDINGEIPQRGVGVNRKFNDSDVMKLQTETSKKIKAIRTKIDDIEQSEVTAPQS